MKRKSRLFYGYIASLVLYSAIVLIPAPAREVLQKYHISVGGVRLLDLTIILLLAAIWFAGFYGYGKFRHYAEMIGDTKDGRHVHQMSIGMLLLVLWLPISSIVSSALNYVAVRHPGSLGATVIINHYVGMVLPLVGYVFIGAGARGLSRLSRQRPSFLATNALSILLIYISLVYIRLVATTHPRAVAYHLSIWPLLLTLVAPYIYMWSVGAMAAYELFIYSRQGPGLLYRKYWRLLAFGFGWLIVTSIAFQFLTTLTPRLQNLSLNALLLLIYVLLILLSVGFVLIALGTRKLQKIEEI